MWTCPVQSSMPAGICSGKFCKVSKFAVMVWLKTFPFAIFCLPISAMSFKDAFRSIESSICLRCGYIFRKFASSWSVHSVPSLYLGILNLVFSLHEDLSCSSSSCSEALSESESDDSCSDSSLLSRTRIRDRMLFPRKKIFQ